MKWWCLHHCCWTFLSWFTVPMLVLSNLLKIFQIILFLLVCMKEDDASLKVMQDTSMFRNWHGMELNFRALCMCEWKRTGRLALFYSRATTGIEKWKKKNIHEENRKAGCNYTHLDRRSCLRLLLLQRDKNSFMHLLIRHFSAQRHTKWQFSISSSLEAKRRNCSWRRIMHINNKIYRNKYIPIRIEI